MRFVCLCVAVLALAASAAAEVELELTIRGSAQELTKILQALEQLGLGGGAETAGEGMRIEFESTADPAPPQEAATPPPPSLALSNAQCAPAEAGPGTPILVTVDALDERRVIDTMSARVAGTNTSVDLYDNGTAGDMTAGDGVWSAIFTPPAGLRKGEHLLQITAYTAYGAPVMVVGDDDGVTSLRAETGFTYTGEQSETAEGKS